MLLNKITETTNYLQDIIKDSSPTIGIVLGTGLGAFVDHIQNPIIIPYEKIPNFPVATVEFHKGNLIFGQVGDKNVVAMQGRFHYYEGYSMQQITFPIRIMRALGVQYLFLSNAAGGVNLDFKKGSLVIIEDHLNFLPDNPLRGLNENDLGERFVDMSAPYNENLIKKIIDAATEQNVKIKKGIYAAVMGPNLETKAEYRWLRSTGADMVGMSTVPEVIVANQAKMACAAISVITDECNPENLIPVNIAEIIEVAATADKLLSSVLLNTIKAL